MKITELREKTVAELKEMLTATQEEVRVKRLSLRLQADKHHAAHQPLRRQIAQIFTLLKDKTKVTK